VNIDVNFIFSTYGSLLLRMELRDIPNIRQSKVYRFSTEHSVRMYIIFDVVKQSNRPRYSRKRVCRDMSPCSDVSSYQCL
jgi:hypothetical protein